MLNQRVTTLAKSNIALLDKIQNQSPRMARGAMKSTPKVTLERQSKRPILEKKIRKMQTSVVSAIIRKLSAWLTIP